MLYECITGQRTHYILCTIQAVKQLCAQHLRSAAWQQQPHFICLFLFFFSFNAHILFYLRYRYYFKQNSSLENCCCFRRISEACCATVALQHHSNTYKLINGRRNVRQWFASFARFTNYNFFFIGRDQFDLILFTFYSFV